MKTQVVAGFVFLGAMASCAVAAEFSIKGSVNETVQGGNNYFLLNRPSGATGQSTTSGTLNFLAQTPTTSYLLNTNYSYYKYFGPGAIDTPLTWGTPAGATFNINHVTELTKYNFVASWSRFDEATALLAQTGTAAGRGSVNTYNVGGNINRDLGRTDAISWSGNVSTVSYSDQSQTPYDDFTTGLTWNHDIGQTTSLVNSVNLDWFNSDDAAKSQRLFWRLVTGIQSRLSSRLTFNADVGVGFVNSWAKGSVSSVVVPPAPPPLGAFMVPPPFQPQVGTGNSILADATLSYDLLKNTKISLTANQSIAPLLTGQLQKSDSIGMALSHNINNYSNFTASAQFTHVPATPAQSSFATTQTGGSSGFFSAVLGYSYQLSREWRSNISYSFLSRDDSGGSANTSIILLSLSRDFTLLGNPAAINKAEAERARQRERNSVGYAFPYFR